MLRIPSAIDATTRNIFKTQTDIAPVITVPSTAKPFFIVLALCTLLLNGCAGVPTTPSLPADQAWEVQQNELRTFNRWQMSGRIGFRTSNNGTSASIEWTQTHAAYQMQLFGPFGAGALQINGVKETFQVSSNEGILNQDEAKKYLKRTFGVDIPLAELSYWVKGLPAPDKPHKLFLTKQGQLSELRQSNWLIKYTDYNEQLSPQMPTKISLKSDELSIKLVVHEWRNQG